MTIKLPPLPEPDYWSTRDDDTPLFTADQLRTAQREAALMALEEAAKRLQTVSASGYSVDMSGACIDKMIYLYRADEAIRALRTELENTK